MSEVVIWFSIEAGNFWRYSILFWQTSALYKIEYYISNLYIPYGQRNDQLDHICTGEVHFHHQYPRSSQLQKPICRPMREKYMSRKIMSLTNYKWNPGSSNVIALDDLKIKGNSPRLRTRPETNLLQEVSCMHVEYRLVICLQSWKNKKFHVLNK